MNIKKTLCAGYAAAFFAMISIPGVMTFFEKATDAENRKLSEFPEIKTAEGKLNTDFTKQFDTYFSEHFGLRSRLVDLHSSMSANIFGTSPEDDVIIGKDGWLFYNYTADDFMGTAPMTDDQLERTADEIGRMEEYAAQNGVRLVFACVPNKNTIYPEYMPYNYIKAENESDLQRLEKKLSEKGIEYISLEKVLKDKKAQAPDKLLYHKTDTHWNNYGAYTAYQAIMDYFGKEPIPVGQGTIENTWQGDLHKMLFPESKELDEQVNYGLQTSYSYVGRFRGLDDHIINTVCPEKENSLLMFRDSFGEAILPFMAESFSSARFERIVPYHIELMENGAFDCAVLEIVERNLKDITEKGGN